MCQVFLVPRWDYHIEKKQLESLDMTSVFFLFDINKMLHLFHSNNMRAMFSRVVCFLAVTLTELNTPSALLFWAQKNNFFRRFYFTDHTLYIKNVNKYWDITCFFLSSENGQGLWNALNIHTFYFIYLILYTNRTIVLNI